MNRYQTISNKVIGAYQTGMNVLKAGVMAGALALPVYQVANAQELNGNNFNRIGVELSIPFGGNTQNNQPQTSLTFGERGGLEGVIGENTSLIKIPLTGKNGALNTINNFSWDSLSTEQKVGFGLGSAVVVGVLVSAMNKSSEGPSTPTCVPAPNFPC